MGLYYVTKKGSAVIDSVEAKSPTDAIKTVAELDAYGLSDRNDCLRYTYKVAEYGGEWMSAVYQIEWAPSAIQVGDLAKCKED